MEVGKKGIVHKFKQIITLSKNGLFWHGIRNNLAKIGLDFMPYYWEIGSINIEPPQIRSDNAAKYQLVQIGEKEITFIKKNIIGIEHKDLMNDLKNGDTCLALYYDKNICIYSFIKHKNFSIRGKNFVLKPNEAYVHNTYTFEAFRGKNLAPYLRYQSYQLLENKGVDTYYSISEYFNKPTIKYKQKLQVRPLKLYLSILLFKKWRFNYTLKSFE